MDKIKGTGVALITPFNEDFSVDYIGLEKLVNHQVDGGIDYLVLMGTTGESAVLSKTEKQEVIAFCKKINAGRLPIVLGIGGNNTLALVEEMKNTDFAGVDAVLSVSPAYNKPTQEGIYQHYKMIAEACPLPIILYNVPGRTASNMAADTTMRLANDFENIVAVKEASGNMDQIMNIIKNKPSDFVVLSGDDGLTLPMIHMGAEGVISVIGQSHPKQYSDMVSFGMSGNKKIANQLHYSLYDYYGPLYAEGNPTGVKACLELLGICKSVVRPPLVGASDAIKNKLKSLMK
ncbi:MAG: 4-hydroxy-tetrahydrodipicolinate synthase [Flavobacteriales bacterium]|jgi:4-hydroxy-tetrahydrodipicolinate synthase|nr:4-hydroxy-tetrahydrodipicolinate synthase [Flavobacteriales bacterium]MBT4882297.1 4-hydroxy-tetrahydrodipicolinate synthase [Flavobacteriales bacterium]MDG1349346.1 4-hydroxy-tetrahydrodipicolinate synthase [Flavobacteriales bacterium]